MIDDDEEEAPLLLLLLLHLLLVLFLARLLPLLLPHTTYHHRPPFPPVVGTSAIPEPSTALLAALPIKHSYRSPGAPARVVPAQRRAVPPQQVGEMCTRRAGRGRPAWR